MMARIGRRQMKTALLLIGFTVALGSLVVAKESRVPNDAATQAKGQGRSFADCLTIVKLRGLRVDLDRNKAGGLMGRCMRGEPI